MNMITLQRRELVWECRECTWTEEDWIGYLHCLKHLCSFSDVARQTYEQVKDLTWDEVVADFQRYQDTGESKSWTEVSYIYENSVRTDKIEYTYTQTLADILIDRMREDNYNANVKNTEYADDYDEDFFIEDIDDER